MTLLSPRQRRYWPISKSCARWYLAVLSLSMFIRKSSDNRYMGCRSSFEVYLIKHRFVIESKLSLFHKILLVTLLLMCDHSVLAIFKRSKLSIRGWSGCN